MNDFQRRFLDILQTSQYIASVARKGQTIVAIDYFGYNVQITNAGAAIATGATVSAFIQIQADSDFVASYVAGNVLNAAGTAITANPVCTIQMTDTGSGKTFFSNPTLFGMVTGSGGFPFLLSAPRVLAPNTNVKIDFTNNTGANVASAYVALLGARIYYAS